MLDVRTVKAQDIRGLAPEALVAAAEQMLQRIGAQSQQLAVQAQAIKFKDTKLEKITFELARLKASRFGAKTEAMKAEQRQMFDEAMAEDQASLEAHLLALQGAVPATGSAQESRHAPARRQPLPEHLRRVEHHHESENITCPAPDCGQPMVRIGQDVSERLDIVPAEVFMHRPIRCKWACKCCQTLVQRPVAPQVIDKGMPSPGLVVLDAGGLVRRGWCRIAAAVRCAPRVRARRAGAARRRDASEHARPRGRQDQAGLHLG